MFSSATSKFTMRVTFSTCGLPNILVTDNSTVFTSVEIFLSRNVICHITSAPYHAATNGLADRAVQTLRQQTRRLTQQYPYYLFTNSHRKITSGPGERGKKLHSKDQNGSLPPLLYSLTMMQQKDSSSHMMHHHTDLELYFLTELRLYVNAKLPSLLTHYQLQNESIPSLIRRL